MEKLVSQLLRNISENPYILVPVVLLIVVFSSRYIHHFFIQKARNSAEFVELSTYKVFSPVDDKEPEGPEDIKYKFGSRRSQIGSQKITLLGSVIFIGGIIYTFFQVKALDILMEDLAIFIQIAILASAVVYFVWHLTCRLDLYERGLVIRHAFGSKGYYYDEIAGISHGYTYFFSPAKMGYIFNIKVYGVTLSTIYGEHIELSGFKYSKVASKMTRLQQNLLIVGKE